MSLLWTLSLCLIVVHQHEIVVLGKNTDDTGDNVRELTRVSRSMSDLYSQYLLRSMSTSNNVLPPLSRTTATAAADAMPVVSRLSPPRRLVPPRYVVRTSLSQGLGKRDMEKKNFMNLFSQKLGGSRTPNIASLSRVEEVEDKEDEKPMQLKYFPYTRLSYSLG